MASAGLARRAKARACFEAAAGFGRQRGRVRIAGHIAGKLLKCQQRFGRDLESAGELFEGINLGGRRVLETLEALDVPVGQVCALGQLFLRQAVPPP